MIKFVNEVVLLKIVMKREREKKTYKFHMHPLYLSLVLKQELIIYKMSKKILVIKTWNDFLNLDLPYDQKIEQLKNSKVAFSPPENREK